MLHILLLQKVKLKLAEYIKNIQRYFSAKCIVYFTFLRKKLRLAGRKDCCPYENKTQNCPFDYCQLLNALFQTNITICMFVHTLWYFFI